VVHAEPRPQPDGSVVPAERAIREFDHGRRDKGHLFVTFRPSTREASPQPHPGRSAANRADFLEKVESWLPSEASTVHAIIDDLSAHRTTDVLPFSLAHPRWGFVCQPKYTAYPDSIEPRWKTLSSPASKGRRFATREAVRRAVEEATAYWNGRRHPFVRGRRRRRRAACRMNHLAIVDCGSFRFRRRFGSCNR